MNINRLLLRTPSITSITGPFKAPRSTTLPRLLYRTADEFRKSQKPADKNRLPQTPTDIKGIDASGYKYLHKTYSGDVPYLMNSEFVAIKFFPVTHFITKLRKSNIALGNFNNPIPILNDIKLERLLKRYSGPYRNVLYFNQKSHPLSTAVYRARLKKNIKRYLFDAVQNYDQQLVRGFYFCIYKKYPNTQRDYDKIQASIVAGLKKLENQQFVNELMISCTRRSPKGLSRSVKPHSFSELLARLPYL